MTIKKVKLAVRAPGKNEAAPEFEDDEMDGDDIEPPHAAIEELEDDSAEPLPEWKVTAWTDLVATLFRPQDR